MTGSAVESNMLEGVQITCSATEHVSLAYHENAVPVVRELVVANASESDLIDVTLRIESRPAVVQSATLRIDRIPAGSDHHIETPDLRLDAALLAGFTEASRLELTAILEDASGERARLVEELRLLPPSHWGGGRSAPELLAAFVRPNDPTVDVILRDAATKLGDAGRETGLNGYTTGKKSRAWELAEAIWAALADRRIAYVLPPASFERAGQKVRGPNDILERKVGTCLDLSLLYAACLEQAGLNPVLVLTAGHALVGVWLQDEDFTTAAVDDMQLLRKRRDLQDLILVETTLLTHNPPATFKVAAAHGSVQVEDEAPAALEVAIDIKRCRRRGIRPMDLGGTKPTGVAPSPTQPINQPIGAPPPFDDEPRAPVDEVPETAVGRVERWKRKLLDLTLRNKLLNFKPGKGSVVLECVSPGALEDGLAAGTEFRLKPLSDVLSGSDERSADLYSRRHHDDGRRSYLEAALARKEIYTTSTEADLDRRLLDLYRLARNGFEEGGANILYLAVGFLSWTKKEGEAAYRAPLLLVPVALKRSSVRAGFKLALHDDEVRINPTLLEMLREDFKLRMPELEGDLPRDESGYDVDGIFRIVRQQVKELRGWEVVPDVVLSAFSFTKYLMWKDLVDRAEVLKRSPVVRHLIDTPKHSYGDGTPFPEPARLDREHPPETVFAPLSADSSQLSAVLAAAAGKDFVLFGPPGTGKSQTIGNMIAQCLAQGRTVLFVSQKTAALEVVQRRLQEIGLGDFCLEVHSTKAQKSAVLGQLRRAWHERSTPSQGTWDAATSELASLREELNGLVNALHRRRENGLSAYEAFGRVIAAGNGEPPLILTWPDHLAHNETTLANLRAACRELRPVIASVGSLADHPLQGVEATQWSPVWRDDMGAAIRTVEQTLGTLRASGQAFAEAIGLPDLLSTYAGTRGLMVLGNYLVRPEARCAAAFLADDTGDLHRAVDARERFQTTKTQLLGRLSGRYGPGVLDQNLSGLLAEWVAAQASNFLVRGGKLRKVAAQIQPYAEGDLPADLGPDITGLIEVAKHVKAGCLEELILARLGLPWSNPECAASEFSPAITWAEKVEQLLDILGPLSLGIDGLRDHLVQLVERQSRALAEGGRIAQAYAAFAQDRAQATEAMKALSLLAGRANPEEPLAADAEWIEASIALAHRWASGLGRAQGWCAWQAAAQNARKTGLTPLIEALEEGRVAPDQAEVAFETAYARWWIDRVVSHDPVLRRFLPDLHEDAIQRFRAADARVTELSKQVVRSRLGGGIPGPTAFGADPEWGTLSHELTKKTQHMPLRKLFGRMPTALTRLTPCVMMSPLSIAQYLPPDKEPFDIVIFDEASQISPWDAVGAIARGKQVVIVGDPEQLPPTNVGDRGVDDIEDGTDVTDQESILDECLAANIPRRNLDWHYRSRHESLIAFSNARYYGGRLVTFPSPVTDDRAVRLTLVPDGVYERGSGRVNRPEARAVVAEIVRRLREPSFAQERRSLGIVTFNGEQQRLIENLLDEQRRSYPELEPYFDKDRWHEPVFVKNLENVQGDERDAIIFSVAVGPDQTGRPVSTVSSLNKDGGHRRLNVAITRARRELLVFASLRPEQIDLGRTRSQGVRDFKHFLEFADRGARALAEAFAPTGGDVESPFEAAVMAGLRVRGWTVHTQIGVSGFRIDLGIVHPDAPGRYLAGVECDGATYHSSATARDRDRLREHVLTDLGWRIRRVWSTEWWMDAEGALAKLDQRLNEDLEADRARAAAALLVDPAVEPEAVEQDHDETTVEDQVASPIEDTPSEPANDPEPITEAIPQRLYADRAMPITQPSARLEAHDDVRDYRIADLNDLGRPIEPGRFYDASYRPVLSAMVDHVLSVEGPIYEELLIRRVARAHGIQRAGPLVREAIGERIDASVARTEDDGRSVLWPRGAEPRTSYPHRAADAAVRSHSDTPMPELVGIAMTLPFNASEAERARMIGQRLGLSRIEASARARFEKASELARQSAAS
ncbi:AAA domain-containing protein [Methylobacterium sp. 275MFSha3.1]|nr:AAA domain-containing protein [Methylobacterium sp. 275MFSha3.1]